MINPKSKEEIEIMKEGGGKLAQVKKKLQESVGVGVVPQVLDRLAEELIVKLGGQASFKKVKGYYWTTCINVNEGVVHGIPTKIPFKEGDIVSVDVGMFYKGFHTDTSFTVSVGSVSAEVKRFLETGREALNKAINKARVGNKISDISQALQEPVLKAGYSPVRALTGHGVGRELHEEPQIPCFWQGKTGSGEVIPEGAVFAIEAIYTLGSPDLILEKDNWTIATKDGKIASLYEETVAVCEEGPLVLTA